MTATVPLSSTELKSIGIMRTATNGQYNGAGSFASFIDDTDEPTSKPAGAKSSHARSAKTTPAPALPPADEDNANAAGTATGSATVPAASNTPPATSASNKQAASPDTSDNGQPDAPQQKDATAPSPIQLALQALTAGAVTAVATPQSSGTALPIGSHRFGFPSGAPATARQNAPASSLAATEATGPDNTTGVTSAAPNPTLLAQDEPQLAFDAQREANAVAATQPSGSDAAPSQSDDQTATADAATQSLIDSIAATAGGNETANAAPVQTDTTAASLLATAGTNAATTSSALLGGLAVTSGAGVGDIGTPPSGQTSATNAPTTPPIVQVALSISSNVTAKGNQNFTLQLKPEQLGKVEVKLEITDSGQATATFKADRPETLQLLQKDSHHLLTALQDAGINADASDLNFALNDQGAGQDSSANQQSAAREFYSGNNYLVASSEDTTAQTPTIASNRLYDIRA